MAEHGAAIAMLALDAAVRIYGRSLAAVRVREVIYTPDPHLVVDVRLRPSAQTVELTIVAELE